ncbi:ARF guanine-nucleotide exchange factor GNL2 [Bienertia sinuspersici]
MYHNTEVDIIQSDDVPASATSIALSALIKLLKLNIFNEKTPGAQEAMNTLVTATTSWQAREDRPSKRGRHPDEGSYAAKQHHEKGRILSLIQRIWDDNDVVTNNGFSLRCVVDIFQFLCSLLNVVQTVEIDGIVSQSNDEDIQILALVLINTALELSGDAFAKHPKLLRMIRDDLFHHLIHYGTRSSALILSMICSTVLNSYHFLRGSLRLQLEAFFTYVLFRVAKFGSSMQYQEVALEGKAQKRKILIAGTHFNEDDKKGLDYLKITHLIPNPPDAKALAYFFRFTPGLNKTTIGDYLGDPDEFNLQVLNEFTNTFDFTGVVLDTALRSYLETFRLPGESQKIHRILEAFSEKFFNQQSSEVFETKDAVFVLCYSLIMLNTDQHNPQVKKKMTEEEFIRNNRAINNGKDLPREYLSELFQSISNHAIAIFAQGGMLVEMNPSRWVELMSRSKYIGPFRACEFDHRLGRDMFSSIAGPTVAALCAIFEQADDDEVLNECIEGIVSVARIAQHGLEDVLDELVASLCKYTTLLNPYASAEETLYIFANDLKPRMATLAVFNIANKFGESVRGAWRNIIECLLKLKRLKLLPQSVVDYDTLVSAEGGSHSSCRKRAKFTTAVEEEETVTFCWDLVGAITCANIDRFSTFWPAYNDYIIAVTQFPLFSPVPFAEKAAIILFKLCVRLLSTYQSDKYAEEVMFKTINLMWKLDKEILDTCNEIIIQTVCKILTEYSGNVQTQIGWKTLLHLLSANGRLPENYDQAVEAIIQLLSEGQNMSRTNYAYCIDCAFGFVALRTSLVEKNIQIMDLMANSVNLLIQWYKECSDPGSSMSNASMTSSSSAEDNVKPSNFTLHLFVKLGEALRKTSLARREEVRNQAVASLKKSFELALDLELTSTNCINCFNYVIFAMVDDLHEKMLDYSRRENAEREMRSMEGTLKNAMELLTDLYLLYLKTISENPGFRTFWLGLLRRMDTCMKADLGAHGPSRMQEVVPQLLKKMIAAMKDSELLVPRENDDLWEITYIQIQWIAPSIKGELFPDVS